MAQWLRSLLVLLVGGAALVFAADVVVRSPSFGIPKDFLEYWTSGRANLRGANPYDPAELLTEQKLADPAREQAVMMWNPPPALALYMPLGAVPPRWAALLWVGLQLAAVFVACTLLWRVYCPAHRWVGALVALSFTGTWWLVAYGQNTGFMLLGLAGFLHFSRANRSHLAGAAAALTALKPHLLACYGVLLVVNGATRRGWVLLLTGAGVVLGALAVALAANPAVVSQFLEAARNPAEGAVALSDWALPVPAYWVRMWLAPDQFWVQFVPCALACAGFLAYRVWIGAAWDWARVLPFAVAVSVLTTPYGGWIFDLPVLLVPVVAAVAHLVATGRWVLAGAVVVGQVMINVASFALPTVLSRPVGLNEYWWVAPAAILLCLPAVRSEQKPDRNQRSGGDSEVDAGNVPGGTHPEDDDRRQREDAENEGQRPPPAQEGHE
jgi:hypothetical protein